MRLYKCPICLSYTKRKDTVILSCECFSCAECLTEWVLENIREMSYEFEDEMWCHTEDCYEEYKIQDIFEKLPREYKEKINEELLKIYLNEKDDVRRCPKFNCPYAGIIPKISCSDNFSCPLCETKWKDYKFSKKKPVKQKVNQNFNKDEFFKYFTKLVFAKKCPKCSKSLSKEEGSSVKVCPCGFKFCGDCGSHFRNHNKLVHLSQTASALFAKFMIMLLSSYLLYNSIAIFRFLTNGDLIFQIWSYFKEFLFFGLSKVKEFVIFNLFILLSLFVAEKKLNLLKRVGSCIGLFATFGITLYFSLIKWVFIIGLVEVLLIVAVEVIKGRQNAKQKPISNKTSKKNSYKLIK